jgi:hypothetical protein
LKSMRGVVEVGICPRTNFTVLIGRESGGVLKIG